MEVKPEKSIEWVRKCIVGRITKAELDDERVLETNSLDIMQNSSIIYHMESVVEMQLLVLITCMYFSDIWAEKHSYGTITPDSGIFKGNTLQASKTMMIILACEHVIAYFFNLYRNYDIGKAGIIDA